MNEWMNPQAWGARFSPVQEEGHYKVLLFQAVLVTIMADAWWRWMSVKDWISTNGIITDVTGNSTKVIPWGTPLRQRCLLVSVPSWRQAPFPLFVIAGISILAPLLHCSTHRLPSTQVPPHPVRLSFIVFNIIHYVKLLFFVFSSHLFTYTWKRDMSPTFSSIHMWIFKMISFKNIKIIIIWSSLLMSSVSDIPHPSFSCFLNRYPWNRDLETLMK